MKRDIERRAMEIGAMAAPRNDEAVRGHGPRVLRSLLGSIAAVLVISCSMAGRGGAYSVRYDPNGATVGSVPVDADIYTQNAWVPIAGNTGGLARGALYFGWWDTKPDGSGATCAPGATFPMGAADVTLFAIYIPQDLTFAQAYPNLTVQNYAMLPPGGALAIPEGVVCVSGMAFANRSALTSVLIPDTVTTVYSSAFVGCSGLSTIELPSSLAEYWSGAFGGCAGLMSITVDPGNKSFISNGGALLSGSGDTLLLVPAGLGSYSIPTSVTTVFTLAFIGCAKITSIVIPSRVTTIDQGGFSGCGLTSVTIPASVTSIGSGAFARCGDLSNVTELAATPPTIAQEGEGGEGVFDDEAPGRAIHVPYSPDHDVLSAYRAASGWSTYASAMDD